MTDKVDFTNLYALGTRLLAAVKEEDVVEARYVIKAFKEGDFGDRKMVMDAIKMFVARSVGEFTYRDVCHNLHLVEKNDKNNASKILSRLVENGDLIRTGKRDGVFRRPDMELNPMEWRDANTEGLNLKFPLEIEKMVKIFPKNIIIIAGSQNAGKSTFCLDFTRLNMENRDIYYFNSEMGTDEFKSRLQLFDIGLDEWRFYPFERSEKFEDVLRPKDVNIIDYLEVTEDFNLVADKIKKIYDALDTGIALIALQKNFGRETGRGDSLSLEKPRLYLSMDYGRMKILKAKNWQGGINPNKKIINFKLVNGSKFFPTDVWHYYGDDPYEKGRF